MKRIHGRAIHPFALALATVAGTITSCDSGGGGGEDPGSARQAVEEDHFVCGEDVGALPSAVWLTTFEDIQELSRVDLRIGNPYPFPITVALTLTSVGLDQRLVKRAQGEVEINPGASAIHTIELDELPIQSVSYSSMGIVELAVDRGTDTIHMASGSFHYHFDETYRTISVYSFDTMNAELNGGQLTEDAFDLRGRVWDGASYVDVTTLRQEEGLPLPWAGPRLDTEPPGPLPEPDPWPAVPDLEVCFVWQAKYVDSGTGYGQDYGNTGQYEYWHHVKAAYTWVHITRVDSYPCPAWDDAEECLTSVWKGYLDAQGCVELGDALTGTYFAWPITYFQVERPGADPCPADPTGPPCPYRGTVVYYHDNDEEGGAMRVRIPFSVNTSDIIVLMQGPGEMNNPGGALSQQLANTAVVSASIDGAIEPPDMVVMSNRRCLTAGCPPDPEGALAKGRFVYTGPWIRANGKPGGLQWKNILAHEYGHVQNHYGTGNFATAYDADNPSQPLCKCGHVVSSNQAHCLQSREEIGSAQLEGMAQFFAAKTWNDPTQANCSLAYYKEFCTAEPCTGPGSENNIKHPPFGEDCYLAPQWRNDHCFNATRGTERDWMTFYWRINNNATYTTELSDLWKIYQGACGGSCIGDPGVSWDTLSDAADTYFTSQNKPNHLIHFENWGDFAGVNENP